MRERTKERRRRGAELTNDQAKDPYGCRSDRALEAAVGAMESQAVAVCACGERYVAVPQEARRMERWTSWPCRLCRSPVILAAPRP